MAKRQVTVVINGEETVSEATDKAGGALGGLSSKIPGWTKSLALMTLAYQAVKTAISAAKEFVMDSIGAYDEFSSSNARMAAQAKITGVSLTTMRDLAKSLRDEFGVGRVAANDFAITVAQYAAATGNAIKPQDLLRRAMDLGAASKLSAVQVSEALQQALRGEDSGFDKLLKRNPSSFWKEYATSIGTSEGKLTDMQKRIAEVTAIMEAGEKVTGSASEAANTAAGKQAKLAEAYNDQKVAVGEALQPIRTFIIQGLMNIVEVGGSVVLAMARVANAIGVLLAGAIDLARSVVGGFAVAIGKLTGNKELEKWGARQADAFGDFLKQQKKLEEQYLLGGKAAEKSAEVQVTAAKKITKETDEERKKRLDAEKKFAKEVADEQERIDKKIKDLFESQADASLKSSKTTRDAFGKALTSTIDNASDAINRIRSALVTAGQSVPTTEFKRLDDQSRGYLATLSLLNDAHVVTKNLNHGLPKEDAIPLLQAIVERLKEQAVIEYDITGNLDDHSKRMELIADLQGRIKTLKKESGDEEERAAKNAKDAQKTNQRLADNVASIARSSLDAAVAFGVIDKSAANTLNSVINIASGIAGIFSGDVTSGVAAILTGIANVVASMLGGDSERKRLLNQNNAALSKLSRDIGALKLNITGEDFAKAQSALGSVVGQLRGGRGAANENDVRNALYAQGLTMEDLDRIAKEFGIEVRTKSGALNVDSVKALFEALGMASPGRVGQSFGDQLSFFQEGQRLDNATGPGAIQGLLDFLRNVGGVTALNGLNADDPAALRAALRNLVTQMNSGKGLQGLGKLTGSQFMDLLIGIIGDLDNLGSGSGAGASGGDITVPTGGGGGGTVSAPTETIQAVIGAMNTNLGTILTGHTAIHERIAVATEGSLMRLTSIDNKMDNLIAVTAGQIDATDAKLEAMRRMAALERGERPVLG